MNTISSLSPEDLADVWRIEQASHAFPWTEKTLLSNQGDRYLNLVLRVNGQLAGFAITQVVLDEATLFNIAIDPACQRLGLGRQLMEALIVRLEQMGTVTTLWLEVRSSNSRAIALYNSMGFNEVSVRRNYYPAQNGREDAIIMALML